MGYKIGSFNVKNLSWGAKSDKLDHIAAIIRQYDIIALQEVLSEGKILGGDSMGKVSGAAEAYQHSLMSRLGDNWDMCWLDPKTDSKWYPYMGNDARGEGYAFLWRKDKFKCPERKDNKYEKEIRPRVYRNYHVDKKRNQSRLRRDPGYGRFQLVNMENAEIRLITTHIIFSKPNSDNLLHSIDINEKEMRRKEFEVLAQQIYTRICDDHNSIDSIVPYTIILGDYNLNLSQSGTAGPYVQDVIVIDGNGDILDEQTGRYKIRTIQTDLTTVKKDEEKYVNNYDHFSYDENCLRGVSVGRAHSIDYVKKVGGVQNYYDSVSDHLPIIVEIDLRK